MSKTHGNNLKRLRIAAKVSQFALAKLAGIDKRRLQDWEQGQRDILRSRSKWRVADALQMTKHEFVQAVSRGIIPVDLHARVGAKGDTMQGCGVSNSPRRRKHRYHSSLRLPNHAVELLRELAGNMEMSQADVVEVALNLLRQRTEKESEPKEET